MAPKSVSNDAYAVSLCKPENAPMKNERSIHLVAVRSPTVHQSVNRVLMLARYLRASVHIVLCSNDCPLSEGKRGDQAHEEARLYLQALCKSISAPDIAITTTIALDGPLAQSAAEIARASRPLLVVKAIAEDANGGRGDWELMQACPVPLLLTRGRPWHASARFAAAVEIPDERWSGLGLQVVRTLLTLSEACGAELDLICAEHEPAAAEGESVAKLELQRISRSLNLPAERSHYLSGSAANALTSFVAQHGYDLLAVGNHPYASRKAFASATVGRLFESVDCDLLFVGVGEPAVMARD